MKRSVGLLLLISCLVGTVISDMGSLVLTIMYCPDAFSSEGATIQVDTTTGNFTILGKFSLGQEFVGCSIEVDPTVTLDQSTDLLYMFFIDEDLLVVLDVLKAQVVQTTTPTDDFFAGYENMAWDSTEKLLKGVSPTVTSGGFCEDGCFEYGDLSADSGNYESQQLIPFKAMMDDSHLYDKDQDTFWIQGSYDLRDQPCGHIDSDECLLALDGETGTLKSAVYTNWTIYKYGPPNADGTILTWMEGFDEVCKNPYNNFLFSKVDLQQALATPIACIPEDVTVDEDEWIASFSLDGTLLATASGNAETGVPQLLIFSTQTGQTKLNSPLAGLAVSLNAYEGLFAIWSVDWV